MTEIKNSVDSETGEPTNDTENGAVLKDTTQADEISLEDSTDESEQKSKETSLEDREEAKRKSAEGQLAKARQLLDEGKGLPDSLAWTKKVLTQSEEQPVKKQETAADLKAELKDEFLYDDLSSKFKNLSNEEQRKVKEKYQKFNKLGLMKGEALKEAMEFANSDKITDEAKRQVLAANSGIPQAGDSSSKEMLTLENAQSDDDIVKALKDMGIQK